MEIYSPGGMADGVQIQDRDPLTVPSTRRNPLLADIFNRLGYMERKGSGFEKIINGYEFQVTFEESKKPRFYSDRSQFRVIMPNLNYGFSEQNISANGVKRGAKNGAKDDDNKLNQLKFLIKQNGKMSQEMMAKEIGVSRRTLQRITEELVESGEIRHVGPPRGGHWEVIE